MFGMSGEAGGWHSRPAGATLPRNKRGDAPRCNVELSHRLARS